MGDHRADIKISFSIHGKTYTQSWWVNWWPDDDGVDRRIKEWFAQCWGDAKVRYDDMIWEAERAGREAAEEKSERAELDRLKRKYGESQ